MTYGFLLYTLNTLNIKNKIKNNNYNNSSSSSNIKNTMDFYSLSAMTADSFQVFSFNESSIASSFMPASASTSYSSSSSSSLLQSSHMATQSTLPNNEVLNGNLTLGKNSSLGITPNDVRLFVEYMQLYKERQKNNTNNILGNGGHSGETLDCSDYCKGEFYQLLGVYNGVHGYVALMICLFGTIANILNIMVLTKKDMAKAPINKILKWLAVADMFVMIEYIPFASYQYIYMKPGEKDFSYAWAVYILFHMHFTQILHTISIGLTVTLAIWRYVAIRHPHGTCASYLLSHCNESILFSFVISPIVCFPTLFVFKVQSETSMDPSIAPLYHVGADYDTKLYRINFWIHSVIIKLLPCCILTIISFVLVKVLCEASKRKQKLKDYSNPIRSTPSAHQCLQKKSSRVPKCDRRTDRTTMLLVAVLILFLITEFPQGILGLMSGIMEKCFFNSCYPPFGEMMDLLALINAAVDFVLYGLMSKQFRTTFKSLFFKTRFGSIELTRATRMTTTCV